MIRDLNTKDLAKDQNFLKKDHNCDPCNDPQTALNNGFISVLAQAAEEEFVDNNTGDLIQKITETEGVRSHDDLVANLDLYQNPNAKSTLDGDLKSASDLESVTEIAALESTELDPAEVAREQATKALQATYRSRKVLLSDDVILEQVCGIQCLPGTTSLFQLNQLSEKLGHSNKDIKVTYEPETRKFNICVGCTRYRATIERIVSEEFRAKFLNYFCKDRARKIDLSKVCTSVLNYVSSNFCNKGMLKVSGAYDVNIHNVDVRDFNHWMNDDDFVEFFRAYATVIIKAIEILNRYSLEYCCTQDPAYRVMTNALRKEGITDVAAIDGTQICVSNEIANDTNVNAAGNVKTADRPDGHRWSDAKTFNTMIKMHMEASILTNSCNAATITEATAAEYKHVDTDRLSLDQECRLFIADRGYHVLLLIARALANRCRFIIRLNTYSSYEITSAYSADGQKLRHLIGSKINSKHVAEAADKYGTLELTVIPKGPVMRETLSEDDLSLFKNGVPRESVKQPTLTTDECRVVVINRSGVNLQEKDTNMFLITNLTKEAFHANCFKTLYTMRWRVETVFKEMKQHCFFQSCNSRNINPALILLYSSLICYQLKTFLYNQAAVECLQSNEDDENCIEYSFDAIMEHLKAASLGITRKFFELKTCLQMFRARAKGLETHVKCVLSVLDPKKPFVNKRNDVEYVATVLSEELINYLRANDKACFRQLFNCNTAEMTEHLINAIKGDKKAIAMFSSLDRSLQRFGVVCQTVEVIKSLRKKIHSSNVSVDNAVRKPNLADSVSFQRVMLSKTSADALGSIFSSGTKEKDISKIIDSSVKAAVKSCKSSHKSLKAYEKHWDEFLKTCYIAQQLGYNDSMYKQVCPDPVEQEKACA